eukprot:3059195-Rhodomonas_salina.4
MPATGAGSKSVSEAGLEAQPPRVEGFKSIRAPQARFKLTSGPQASPPALAAPPLASELGEKL